MTLSQAVDSNVVKKTIDRTDSLGKATIWATVFPVAAELPTGEKFKYCH